MIRNSYRNIREQFLYFHFPIRIKINAFIWQLYLFLHYFEPQNGISNDRLSHKHGLKSQLLKSL